ncbi:MAG: response regulator [Elusimicrobia bacterium]|nr:response regulator [Candidatus Liberimonas magnetica]
MKKVLVVDDERDVCALLQHILKGQGYKTEIAHNGTECLDKIKYFKPDLVMLDINMPHMDGWQVLECLRSSAKTKELPVIMCTERNMIGDIDRADKFGINGYITKPFIVERVLRKVEDNFCKIKA